MQLTTEIHLLAGIGALTMGVGVLLASAALRRSRVFAWLCGSLALWNLGFAALATGLVTRPLGEPLFLVGSCASAPLALDLALMLSGRLRRNQRTLVRISWILAIGLWAAHFLPGFGSTPAWESAALIVLGGIFVLTLAVVAVAALRADHPAERSVMRRLFLGGSVAVVGGLSDFLPRSPGGYPQLGALAVLFLLIVLCSAVVRYRFLDVHVLLVRAAALLAGAGLASLLVVAAIAALGLGVLPVYLVMLPVLALSVPVGQAIARRTAGGGKVVEVLGQTSARLPRSRTREELLDVIEQGQAELPRGMSWVAYVSPGEGDPVGWRRIYQSRAASAPAVLDPRAGLAAYLRERGRPLTRPELRARGNERGEARGGLALEALEQIEAWGLELVVPLWSESGVVGLMGLGGRLASRHLGPEVCTSLMAVGQQAMDAFERIEATEIAKRQEALAAVGEMAGGLAHEVQNPVAAIQGAAQVLLAGRAEDQDGEMLEVIEQETQRLGRVVREFLDYARPAPAHKQRIDLEQVIHQTHRGLATAGIALALDLDLEPSVRTLEADSDQLQRAFGNLLRNAFEAGAKTLRVTGRQVSEGRLRLRLEDDGPGFREQDLPHLFVPFFTRGKSSGTGLGLALVAQVVQAHGGLIRAENRSGGGAAFDIELPVERKESA